MGLFYLKMSNQPLAPNDIYFAIALNEAGRFCCFNFIWNVQMKFIYFHLFGKRWSKTWLT